MADDTGEIGREAAEAVDFANIKSLGEGGAFYHNLAMSDAVAFQRLATQNALANQQAMNQISLAAVGKIVEMVINTAPSEGASETAIAQILAKLAQTTNPPTGAVPQS